MKKKILFIGLLCTVLAAYVFSSSSETVKDEASTIDFKSYKSKKTSKKSMEAKMEAVEERSQFEYDMQKNPGTGLIPLEERQLELSSALESKEQSLSNFQSRSFSSPYISRGPSNLGGRTRSFAIDISDTSGNTMLAGGVSSGLYRSTDGGASWVKVSSNDDISNVTAIAQDPRPGFQNRWYYGTGELLGNSASLGAFYRGQGIWESVDSGVTWTQMPATNSAFETFTTAFDIINSLAVSPVTGELFVAAFGTIFRYDGVTFNQELSNFSGSNMTDVKVTETGRVYVAFSGNSNIQGIYTSVNGNGGFVSIAENGAPVGWSSTGRAVLGIAPSNPNIVYVLYRNGNSGGVEADLWRFDLSTGIWTDFSGKLPDEPGGDLQGNDPFAIQGGYDLEVSVKPDDENFVVIGGTNTYRINNINTDATFDRIGGYISNTSFGLYNLGGGDDHHPDIHDLVFSPFNNNLLYSGTDGGVHSADITNTTVGWTNLNNNYQTYQYYYVAMDQQSGSSGVIGGAQDNGTTLGGAPGITGLTSDTEMLSLFGGDGVAVAFGRTGSGNNINDIQLYFGTQRGPLFTLRNGGFTSIRPAPTNGSANNSLFVTYFYLDTDTNTMYYANGDELYRALDASTVNSVGWDNIGSLNISQNIRSVVSTRGTYTPSSYTLIGGESGGVFRHDDPRNTDLSTAVNITPTGASTSNFSIVSGLAIHPTNPDIAMAVYSNYGINNIFITSNATSAAPTWTLVERNLASFSIRSAAIVEVNGQIGYFVGTARGLYASQDPTTTDWQLEGPNDIGLAVVSGLVYRPSDNILLVGTHGNGMYQSDLTTLGVNTFANVQSDIAVYPNPTSGPLTIAYSGRQVSKNVNIVDINGKTLRSQNFEVSNSKMELDLQEFSTGIYFVNITLDTGDVIVKKLIIR